MMKLQKIYMMLAALTLAFAGCDKFIYDQEEVGGSNNEPLVYLSVNVRAAQPKSGLRAAGDPSINTDAVLYEDKVYDLAMLVFNSGENGSLVGSLHLNTSLGSGISTRAFQVELIAGKEYDFYFVANMPAMGTALAAITTKAGIEGYLNDAARQLSESLYQGASVTEGFPMARVYKNQLVEAGGTVYQPKPFYPKQYDSEEYTVVANALGEGADIREYVELIRVVAKFELVLDETTETIVDKVSFRNANRNFRLVEFETQPTAYFNDETKTVLAGNQDADTDKFHYIFYMPEAMIGTTSWDAVSSPGHAPINYFSIETLDGREYDIPIITYDGTISKEDYLDFATGDDAKELYSIYRNRLYRYEVNIEQKIEIFYDVDPWKVVERYTYLGYGYTLEMDSEGNITITNTIDDCIPHHVRLEAVVGSGAYFEPDPSVTEVNFGIEEGETVAANDPRLESGYTQGFTINKDAVDAGVEYLNVYYNGELVKTFTK